MEQSPEDVMRTDPHGSARAVLFTACVGAAFVAAATAVAAGVTGFLPPSGFVGDFTQDWLSAREVLAGRSAYGPLPDALRRHGSEEPPADFFRWNAHPPVSVLLVLPFAALDHDRAFFAWNLATFPLFVLAVWVAASELGVRGWRAAALAAALSVIGLTSHPLFQQLILGQFNALLALLITVAWAADRHDRGALAGVAVGVAAAVKLFPAFLLLYFLGVGRWRAVWTALGVFLLANGLAAGLFGLGAYRTYAGTVVPAVWADHATKWNNLSVSAFWLRLFDPTPSSRVTPLAHWPTVGKVLAVGAQLVVAGAVAWVARRARSAAGRDRVFATAAVGMVLASPIAWPHYLVVFVAPVAVLVAALPRGAARWALVCCLAVLWLPDTFLLWAASSADEARRLSVHRHEPLAPAGNLLLASAPHYALLGVFLLALRLPASRVEPRPLPSHAPARSAA